VLPKIAGCTLVGNTPGGRILGYGNGLAPGEFDQDHLIFSGINYLYEGVTICYPEPVDHLARSSLVHLATSSNEHPCISHIESTEEHGRVIIDSGFTKLYCSWTSAGQARYVVNACVYLVDIERRCHAV